MTVIIVVIIIAFETVISSINRNLMRRDTQARELRSAGYYPKTVYGSQTTVRI